MNPINNPYSPGAGSPPPELAGRSLIRNSVMICIERLKRGKSAKSIIIIGLRGVGKTVLLEQMRHDAEANGAHTIQIEAPENRSLPAILAPQLRLALLRLSRVDAAKELAIKGLRALTGFANKLKITYNDIEVGLDYDTEPGLADNGDLESDLTVLLEQVGLAAQKAGTVLVIFLDELQYVAEDQIAALISALHRCAQHLLPITVIGAGLPQLRGRIGNAKTYAERLFNFTEIGPLEEVDAKEAIIKPAKKEGVALADQAVDLILAKTQGYPYFLQEWCKHAWDIADQSPITSTDVEQASIEAIATLDESFFRVRFDRLTVAEKKYLRAMAELGPGPHRSGDIAVQLNRSVQSFGPIRSNLIQKGMIWSPSHGDTAFTVPLFDEFMKRIMPGEHPLW